MVVGTHSVSSFVRYDTTADEPSTPNPCVTTGAGKETVVSMDIMSLPVPGSLHPSMIRSRSHQVAGAASSTRYPASVSSVYGSILGRPLTSTDWPIGAESIVISTIDGRISTASMMPQELPSWSTTLSCTWIDTSPAKEWPDVSTVNAVVWPSW